MGKTTGILLEELPSFEVEPSRLYDVSGNEYHGTHTDINMVQLPCGLWVRSFNGSTSGINCGTVDYNSGAGLTVAFWVRLDDVTATNQFIFTAKYDSGNDIRYYYQNGLYRINFDDGSESYAGGTVTWEDNEWRFCVATHSVADSVIRIYDQAVEVDNATGATFDYAGMDGLTYIGKRVVGTPLVIAGDVALFRMYNHPISAEFIRSLFHRQKWMFGVPL